MKDLDDEVLAYVFDPFVPSAWIEISAVIRGVCKDNFWMGTRESILHVLNLRTNRYTCWSQDLIGSATDLSLLVWWLIWGWIRQETGEVQTWLQWYCVASHSSTRQRR